VVTRGVFDRLSDLLTKTLASGSSLSGRDAYWQKQKTTAATTLTDHDEEFKRLDQRYRLSFGQMDSMVRELNSTGDFLSNQMKMWTSGN
jgi:flagellar capping protein FliD